MKQYIQNFKKFQPLLEELVARDIKIKYRRSVLGVLWTLLNPLLMMIVLSVVFSNLFKFDVENFPLFILSGQVIFNFFSESTTNAMGAILGNASLIRKIYVPKYLFVISRIFSSFINLMASFTALILVMVATRAELHWTVILVPIPLVLLVIFSMGIGLILSAVQRYHAFILCIHYSTDVSDTDYLSNVNFTGMAETNRKFESNYQYPADVQRCDVGLYNL